MKSSTKQKVSQLVQNCKYLPEILNSTTVIIFTRRSQRRLEIFMKLSNLWAIAREHWKIKVSNIGSYLRRRCGVVIDDSLYVTWCGVNNKKLRL